MATTGPTLPSIAANLNASSGLVNWTNPERVTSDDGSSASASIGLALNSEYLIGLDFKFNIPTDATIDGIIFEAKKAYSIGGPAVRDVEVRLVKNSSIVGTNKASGSDWPFNVPSYVSYGGAADLWGTTWTPSEINSSVFGVTLNGGGVSFKGNSGGLIDAYRITVTYTPAAVNEWYIALV